MGYNIDSSEVRKLAFDLSRADGSVGAKTSKAIRKTAFAIERSAKQGAPVDTGNLVNSISTDITGDGRFGAMEAEIGPTANYGDDVEFGTGPHIIRAKNSEFLRFVVGGRVVFVREVHHPGTAPQPYLGPAFDKHAPNLERLLGDAGEEIL